MLTPQERALECPGGMRVCKRKGDGHVTGAPEGMTGSGKGLSGGAIAGIVVAVIAALLLLAIAYASRRQRIAVQQAREYYGTTKSDDDDDEPVLGGYGGGGEGLVTKTMNLSRAAAGLEEQARALKEAQAGSSWFDL